MLLETTKTRYSDSYSRIAEREINDHGIRQYDSTTSIHDILFTNTTLNDIVYELNAHENSSSRSIDIDNVFTDNQTLNADIAALAQRDGVPAKRLDEVVTAITLLLKDARLEHPVLLPKITAPSALPSFPSKAPEKWVPRGKELPEDFAVRVYGNWMKPDNTGISTAEIFRLDEPLGNALRRSPRAEKPEGFHLPSKTERINALLKLKNESGFELPTLPPEHLELKRLQGVEAARRHRLSKNNINR